MSLPVGVAKPIHEAPPSGPNLSPKAPPPRTITWAVRISARELEETQELSALKHIFFYLHSDPTG